MAFDPDEYLRGSAQTPSVTAAPASAEVTGTQAAPVSGFDPDAYLQKVGSVAAPTAPGSAPTAFNPDAYLANVGAPAPKETGILADATNYIKEQADILGSDLRIGAINTGIAADNLKLAGLMELQESRKAKYGDNLDAMPEDVRKDHIATGKAIEKTLAQVSESSAKIRNIEQTSGVRGSTKAFNDIRQTPEYQAAPFLDKAKMVGEKFIQDPVGIVTDLGLQSLPQSLGIAATALMARVGLLSPTAAAGAGGATSAMMEFGNQYAALRQEGMDHKEAWEKAGVKSGVIGMFDAASFKLAGTAAEDVMKNISKGAFKETAKTVGKETAKQAGLGAAGEAVSSVAIGQPIDPGEVLAEAAGEIFGAPGEAVSTYRSERARGIAPEPRMPEPPEARVTPTPEAPITPAAPAAPVAPVVPESAAQNMPAMMSELTGAMKTEPIELPPVAKAATTEAPVSFENIERPQLKTPQFQQWFGDSKAKDESGAPKVMYHGTTADFKAFDPEKRELGFHVGETVNQADARIEDRTSRGEQYQAGSNVMPVYVQANNPYDIVNDLGNWNDMEMLREYLSEPGAGPFTNEEFAQFKDSNDVRKGLQAKGYDSISYDNQFEDGGGKAYIVFEPEQIKSATGNKGTFSPTSPDITENIERQYILPSAFSQQMERAPGLRTELKRLNKMFKAGRISADIMANQAGRLLDQTKKQKEFKPRLRGQNILLEKMNAAARKGELSQDAVDFATWFVGKNPNVADDISVSIRQPGEKTPSGSYSTLSRMVTLFKESNNSETAVHEILHHSERMMPESVQDGIRNLWLKSLTKAAESADKAARQANINAEKAIATTKDPEKLRAVRNAVVQTGNLSQYFDKLINYHIDGSSKSLTDAKSLITSGYIDYSNYQYMNPSEFWAVNATEIAAGRFEGSKSFLGKLKQWLKEFAEKAKSLFGLNSDAPIIRALDSLSKADGKFKSDSMLAEGTRFENVEPEKVKIDRKNYKGDPAPLATWAQEPANKYISDDFIYKMQDRLIDTKRTIQAIKKQVGDISTKWDTYKREILYHGRASDAIKKFLRYDVQTLVESIDKMGLTMPEVKDYLHNRHAQERNENVARINPSLPDAGSGIATADAKKYLKDLPADKKQKLEAVAKTVDAIIKKTQQVLIDTGQETEETIKNWNKAYKYYVPLFREDLDYVDTGAKGTGQGFSVRGAFTKRAMGSVKPVEDILSNVISSYERAVGRGEKNLVIQSLYGLAIQNPNPDFWMPLNPDAISSTKQAKLELSRFGISPTDVDNLMREPMESYIDPKTGLVGQRLKQSIRDSNYALPLRIEGKQRFIVFNPNNEEAKRMVMALKNMDLRDIHAAFNFFAKFTRWFVGVNTQYNPLFGMVNFLRDVQGSAINLSTTPLAGKQREVMVQAFKNVKDVYKALRAETKGEVIDTEIGKQFADMQAHGGQTGYRDAYQQKTEQHKIIEDTLARMEAGPAKKGLMASLEMLSDVNDAMENATRLAVYQAAINQKLDKDEAAILAKTISVNFNKRGAWTQEASALYGFFNSSVQGTTRTLETLAGPAGKKIIAGGIALGVIQALALAMAGFDDEQPPPFVRDKNLVIPIPGTDKKYLTWPMPLGLNILPNIGRSVTELMLSGGKDAGKKMAHLLTMTLDSFNPFGSSESVAQLISPTFADPIIALAENKDAFGRPIYKKDKDTAPTPGHTRAKDTASVFSKEVSKFLNFMTGGSEDRKGGFSPTPDQIDYVIGQVTGGIGRELMKIDQSLRSLGSGEELPPYKIPVAGRFYGDAAGQAAQSGTFYENVTQLSQFEREIKGRTDRREGTESIYRDHPEARLWRKANRVENDISDLNKKKRDLIVKNAPPAQIKMIEEQKRNKMAAFNKEYEAAKK